MAWEQRRGGKYFYRSFRSGGKVQKTYFGRGSQATAAEQEMAEARARRESDRQAVRQLQAALMPLDVAADEIDAGADILLGALLHGCGFHEHRGAWRRKRGSQQPTH